MDAVIGSRARNRAFIRPLLARVRDRFVAWRERRRARLAGEHLDAYWLRDIGIERRPPDVPLEQIRSGRRMWL